ncbi:MAG: peptidoglycan-binding domain-containing protein [Pseudomonadota bacterium]
MKRIIIHWTAGGGRASDVDRKHYHRLTEYDGTIVAGTHAIEDNIVVSDGDYAAHTRNLNTDSIGTAMCGMRGAKEHPFDAGPSPITEKQFRTHCIMVADLCRQYSIPVTRKTVLTHAEVEPTLGVKQRGKWDLTRLPFRPDIVGALAVGDYLRDMVREVLGEAAPAAGRPTLKRGNMAPRHDVIALQKDLAHLGYASGRADGLFGRLTHAAVMAFQADNGLISDGIVGPATWAALESAHAAPMRAHSEDTLRAEGSLTIKQADAGEAQAKVASAGMFGLSGLELGQEALEVLADTDGMLAAAQETLLANWPIVLVMAIAAGIYFRGPQIMAAIREIRVNDAATGKHLGR